MRAAASMGMPGIAMTDHDHVSAAVKFTQCCRQYGVKPILGAEVTMEDGTHLTLLAETRAGYANLCRLLTSAYADGGRLTPRLRWSHLPGLSSGLICLSGCIKGRIAGHVARHEYDAAKAMAQRLAGWFGGAFYLELQDDRTPDSARVARELAMLGDAIGVPSVATNNVHYAASAAFAAHDLLRCVRAGVTVRDIHPERPFNNQRWLKNTREMQDLFGWRPDALANTVRIADHCEDVLPGGADITPRFDGDAARELRRLAYEGAKRRYRTITAQALSPTLRGRLEHELSVITTLGYADYILMVRDVVRWARAQGIRATGRGSAADCCVAYCLDLTDVDVIARNLPFARFLKPGKTPDIDMDFPSSRRDEVFEHVVTTYGEENTGVVCTFHTYWARSAVRDIGKALALPADALSFLASHLSHFVHASEIGSAFDTYAELRPHKALREQFQILFTLCASIAGFPRHMGSHSSGVVISRVPLATIAPLTPSARGITQIWTLDKDDAETVGAIKFDILALRMLSAVADAEDDLRESHPDFRYDDIPIDDTATYNMIQSGKAIGAFQFESAAQLALAVTLQPTHFEDLVASVALIRPGPVRGNVVNRFVAARNGYARADVLHTALETALAKTYGCVVFQEQVNDVFQAMTGCSEADADAMRKALTKHTKEGTLDQAGMEFIARARARHPDLRPKTAYMIWKQIEGWAGYGFIEGHAAAFALTGYRTAYLSVHHTAEFFAGIMSEQPMGFYSANTLAAEARRRGVRVLPLDINESGDKCHGDGDEIRLGLRLLSDLRADDIAAILAARDRAPFASLLDFCARLPLRRDALENLILAGAFDALHSERRGLLWALDQTIGAALSYRATGGVQRELALGDAARLATPCSDIDDFSEWERFLWTWRLTGVTAECHVMSHFRERLAARGFITASQAQEANDGAVVRVAGINIRPHRPPTRSGKPVLFSSLEDETDILQLITFGEAIDRCTSVFLLSQAVMVEARVQRKGKGVTLIVQRAAPFRVPRLAQEVSQGYPARPTLPVIAPTEYQVK
ncbi:DNA-directed DNA polymerase [Capsulimonas corticalis]|uniref:DNA-directed DNA polymerase n=1 Tax=Capsulimonas corticalis TaxID=2219043 RepID=A0A402CNP4_9BACT|nr:DNA-directed DNA polymerase [Capsulimonas corticalis]